jgi:tetratricopeptide (TPR) repeat protein
LAAGRLDDARDAAQEVVDNNARYVPAYDLLARVAEARGDEDAALEVLNQSYDVIPSARRSRMLGEVAYRTGHLELAGSAYERALRHTKGSLTAQPSDLLSLAQVYVDAEAPQRALQLMESAPKHYAEAPEFDATQAALQAQAHARMGNADAAEQAYQRACGLIDATRADSAMLALAKAAFSVGKDEDGARLLSAAVKADHENTRIVSLARKVLKDSGREALAADIVDGALKQANAIVAEANALMRQARFDESLARLDDALQTMPDNTGVLLAAAQLHLLWMSQKGLNLEYVAKVNGYLSRLDTLLPGNERVFKMYRFMRETLSKAAK